MDILHISAECYPAAKAGGLADVVGALPKYLAEIGHSASVVMPKYYTPWLLRQDYEVVHTGVVKLSHHNLPYAIEKVAGDPTGFPLYVANLPGKFDRPGIYSDPGGWYYHDELERFLCFQQAALDWVLSMRKKPDLLHCHDHHTGLTPFLMKHSPRYRKLAKLPSVFTIHNGEYAGAFPWDRASLLPEYDREAVGLLDWNHAINPLATGIKCAWAVTTVSPQYLRELQSTSDGLGWLLEHESDKSRGMLNGIDQSVWDPTTDPLIDTRLEEDVSAYKQANRNALFRKFKVRQDLPIVSFIGRLVKEKGADLIPDLLKKVLSSGQELVFLVLGTGEVHLHEILRDLVYHHPGYFDASLEYNEALAHQLYAGSDFLFMPSRVEPCGLNQMYAMRYGTVPVVRSVGGLVDSVIDLEEDQHSGRGIRFDQFNLEDSHHALSRAIDLYWDKSQMAEVRNRIMHVDLSWQHSAGEYAKLYQDILTKTKAKTKTKTRKKKPA